MNFINPEKLKANVHEMIRSLEEQYQKARDRHRRLQGEADARKAKIEATEEEWRMASQRREALMDLLSVIDEMTQK